MEFEEIRAYLPGDDTRAMDWRVTARTGSPHVRVTREEHDRPAMLIVDQRQSMFFGTRLNMKSVTTAEIAALAAWRILAAGDRVGGMVVTDTGLAQVPAARSRGAVLRLLSQVARANAALSATAPPCPEAAAMLNRALAQAAGIVHHDWLVLIVSDFDGADDLTFAMLSRMARGNDLVLALVHDPAAHEVPRQGRVVVGDGELQVALDLSSEPVRRNLAEARRERLRGLIAWQHRLPLSVLPVSAGEETLPQLQRLFAAPARQGTRGFDTPRGAA
ncbi:DUF58 domain-containing protein (plasmid) [Paracoccus yeei]